MKKNTLVGVVVLALIVGHISGYLVRGIINRGPHNISAKEDLLNNSETMNGTMQSMVGSLDGKTGDEFDKAFIAGMIVHHEGAVAMARAAQQNAQHPQIKQMAQEIITAQTREITQMAGWLKSWYGIEASLNSGANGTHDGMGHSI